MVFSINIKSDFPPADVAVATALNEIEVQKLAGRKIIKIVHGHGSHAKGGLIKTELHKALTLLKQKGGIKDFVKGENFTQKNPLYNTIIRLAPEIIVDNDFQNINMGITLILL